MFLRRFVPLSCLLSVLTTAPAATIPRVCGTYPERVLEEMHLSRQETARRLFRRELAAPGTARDIGNIAVIDRTGGVVGRRNDFDLVGRSVAFEPATPGAASYRVSVGAPFPVPADGTTVVLRDDDSAEIELPFAFPYYGRVYRSMFVNSDGNLTFGAGDGTSLDRSLGRMVAGPPRIAPLFRDLDPARSGRVALSREGSAITLSWLAVPEFRSAGIGPRQTFAARLEESGRIAFSYEIVATDAAVTGIGPGEATGATSVVSFDSNPDGEYAGTVAETFEINPGIDLVRVGQRFYESHGDNYDYLVVFNSLGISAAGAIAFQMPVRVKGSGYGLNEGDNGRIFGSARRLQSVLNMGPLSQYPADPNQVAGFRPGAGETTLTILAHEAGHQYLSFVSVEDPRMPSARPMLGRQLAHWSFFFNSDASVMEGNRIADGGESASPRFRSVATAEGFSALDRYLMGLGSAEEVPPSFYVRPSLSFNLPSDSPRLGATFSGERVDIPAETLVSLAGRRTPDHTVAQNRFRLAFVLVTEEGANPSPAEIEKLDRLRREFEGYYGRISAGRATADTALRQELRFENFPAAGVVAGGTGRLAIALRESLPSTMTIRLTAEKGLLEVPETVTIAAGSRRVEFPVAGHGLGVEELRAMPERAEFETAFARIQIADASKLRITATDLGSEVLVRVSDQNRLPYPGAVVTGAVQGSSTLVETSVQTDSAGTARFEWTRGLGAVEFSAGGATAQVSGIPVIGPALNAASLEPRVSPGSLVSAWGLAVAGPDLRVTVAGQRAEIVRSSFGQVDFVVPQTVALGDAPVVVSNGRGEAPAVQVRVAATAPAVFVDGATSWGSVVAAGQIRPFARGEIVEIYATGLANPVEVRIGGVPAEVLFAGMPPSLPGVWQVNAVIPAVPSGEQQLIVTAAGEAAKPVRVRIAP